MAHGLASGVVHPATWQRHAEAVDAVAKQIWAECVRRRIRFLPLWVPRTKNKFSDWLSKIEDGSDWMLSDEAFSRIDGEWGWGPHTVDRFASYLNQRCERFNARWYCREAEVQWTPRRKIGRER